MELKKFNIQLDIKKRNYNEVFQVVQGDYETNVLEIQLLDDVVKYNLTDLSVEIAFRKADGTTVLQTSDTGVIITSTTEGKLECTLKTNTIAAIGRVIAEVRVLGANDKLLTSTTFDFIVRESLVNDETIESTNEFPVLGQLISTAEGLITQVNQIEKQVPEQVVTDLNQVQTDLTTHKAESATQKPHGATSVADGNTIVARDTNGRIFVNRIFSSQANGVVLCKNEWLSTGFISNPSVTSIRTLTSTETVLLVTRRATGGSTGVEGLYLVSRQGTGTYITPIVPDTSLTVTANAGFTITLSATGTMQLGGHIISVGGA